MKRTKDVIDYLESQGVRRGLVIGGGKPYCLYYLSKDGKSIESTKMCSLGVGYVDEHDLNTFIEEHEYLKSME